MRSLPALALVCASLLGCGRAPAGSSEKAAEPTVLSERDLARVEAKPLQTGPRISGSLEARERAVIRAETSGSVLEARAEIGDVVKKNQLLGRIEDQLLRESVSSAATAVASAESGYEVAKREAERNKTLLSGGAISPQQAENATAAADAAKASLDETRSRLASLRDQLDSATVRSPMNGIVSERGVSQGDVVQPGAMLFTVIDPSSMRLSASVTADALNTLERGRKVEFEVRGYPGEKFIGEIERIAPAADPVTRQIRIIVAIPNTESKLVAGLFAKGRVVAESREVASLPLAAVERDNDPPTVKRVRDGKVEEVPVELGLLDEVSERVEVRGLELGDVVLLGPARNLPSGAPVELMREGESAPRAAPASSASPTPGSGG